MKTDTEKLFTTTLSASAFFRLVSYGVIVDGRAGGLILGAERDKGGVSIIRQRGDDFHLMKDVASGGDLVLRVGLKVPAVRKSLGVNTGFTNLLITHAEPDNKLLWLTWDQEIVSEDDPRADFGWLSKRNAEHNMFLRCNRQDVFEPDFFCER